MQFDMSVGFLKLLCQAEMMKILPLRNRMSMNNF